ncbi:hypothetical protein T07_808 [Trichinella nelsoni]|uniref:Uncharacterized protein n=1 Tax=Trichinella nelsoni TaxID=6336 RepID=A0A0V0REG6_9BILA|nr:hypothetical protein T07_808 [Trichinella nelsoni]
MILKFGCIEFSGLDSNEQKKDTEMDSVINNTTISDKCTINPLMDCWVEPTPGGIFVRSTKHRKVKMYVVGLLGWAHPTLEKHATKNAVHDGIKPSIGKKGDSIFFFSSCGLSSAKFVKKIADLSRARYSAHFDTKLSFIVIFLVPKRLLSSS